MTREPTDEEVRLMDDFRAVLKGYPDMDAMRILMVASHFVGNMTALQDQRKYTIDHVMEAVGSAVMLGNHQTVEHFTLSTAHPTVN